EPIVASVPRPVLGRRPATLYHECRSRPCSLRPPSVVTATGPFGSRRASCRTPASTPAPGLRNRHAGVGVRDVLGVLGVLEVRGVLEVLSDASGRPSRYRRPRSSRVSQILPRLRNMLRPSEAISLSPKRATPPTTLSGSEPTAPASVGASAAPNVQL